MTSRNGIAAQYFSPPLDKLWTWGDQGEVVLWRNGKTVAYRDEIRQLLERLAPGSMPPFESVVFLLAATRGIVPTADELFGGSPLKLDYPTGPQTRVTGSSFRGQARAQALASLDTLREVRTWPEPLIATFHGKKTLLDVLVEAAPVELQTHEEHPCQWLNGSVRLQELPAASASDATFFRTRRIHTLARALAGRTPEEWLARAETSAEKAPAEAKDLNLPWMERARRWMDQLEASEEHRAIARAARSLLAALRLPRELGKREEMEINGSADIANRGPLDRLLLSELANDDLTLTVRLALNEALYLRREPPATRPPQSLHLLFDTSLPLWGQPRFLTTAAALAFMASKQDYQTVHCWRTAGDRTVPAELLTTAGLREHLGALEPTAHPGGALADFHGRREATDTTQRVLLTHRDTLDDPDFLSALLQFPSTFDYYATVDRTGLFEVRTHASTHAMPLCRAMLDLDELFQESELKETQASHFSRDAGKPAFLSINPCPFLIPTSDRAILTVPVADEAHPQQPTGYRLAITTARQIVHYKPAAHGVQFLGDDLPGGRVLWMDSTRDGVHILLEATTHHPDRLISYLSGKDIRRVVELPKGLGAVHACRSRHVVLVSGHDSVLAYSLATGEPVGQIRNPPQRLHGRYYQDNNTLLFLEPKFGTLGLEKVVLPGGIDRNEIVTLFDRLGHSSPWMLLASGWIAPTTTSDFRNAGIAVPQEARRYIHGHQLSVDGNQIEFILLESGERLLMTLDAKAEVIRHQDPNLLDSEWRSFPQTATLRNVHSIAILPDGVWMRCTRNRIYMLHLEGAVLKLTRREPPFPQVKWLGFSNKPTIQTTLCALRSATLGHGSTAWMDNRGLLHLRSHDPALPELTFLLSLVQVAAWTSEGKVCGPTGFLTGNQTTHSGEIFSRLLEIHARL